MFTAILLVVAAVIIALIIYTLTMDKLRSIATLKLVGAPDRTIIGLIVQQALTLGIVGYAFGLAMFAAIKDYFPHRVQLEPGPVAALFVVVVIVLASVLSIRAAVKVDPSRLLRRSTMLCPWLGGAKTAQGERLGSRATYGEGAQNVLCAILAGAVLVGLAVNTLFGLWWLIRQSHL